MDSIGLPIFRLPFPLVCYLCRKHNYTALKKITRSNLVAGLATSSALNNISEDTTPQLGGNLDINEYKETNSSYIVKLYNADGYDFHFIKLEKNNLDIKESIDLNRIKTEFNAKCKF